MPIYWQRPGEGAGGGAAGGKGKEEEEEITLEKLGATLTQMQGTMKQMADRNQQLEGMFVSPDFLEYLDSKQRPKGRGNSRVAGAADTGAPAEGAEMTEEQLDALPPSRLLKVMLQAVKAVVDEKFETDVEPRLSKQELKEATEDVVTAAQKYEDFFQWRQQMLQVSKQHPTLLAEDLYLYAVRRAGKEPKLRQAGSEGEGGAPPKVTPPKKPARTETPGMPAGARKKDIQRKPGQSGFQQAFDQAFQESGLEE
jgi:hypothetical protein